MSTLQCVRVSCLTLSLKLTLCSSIEPSDAKAKEIQAKFEVLEEREEAKSPQTWNLRMKRATLKALMGESDGSDGDNENLFNKELSSIWRWCGGCWCRRQRRKAKLLLHQESPVFEDSELSHLAKTGEDGVNVGVARLKSRLLN